MKDGLLDVVLGADVAKVSVTHDDVHGVIAINVSVPYLTLLIHSKRTQVSLNDLIPLCQNAVSQAIHSWLSEKSESDLPSIGSIQG